MFSWDALQGCLALASLPKVGLIGGVGQRPDVTTKEKLEYSLDFLRNIWVKNP